MMAAQLIACGPGGLPRRAAAKRALRVPDVLPHGPAAMRHGEPIAASSRRPISPRNSGKSIGLSDADFGLRRSSGGSCTACTSNSTCASAIGSAQGDAAKVSATHPCGLTYRVFGFLADCTISVSADMLIR